MLLRQLERAYGHLFTQVILNTATDRAYQRIVETLRRQSREPYWAAVSLPLPQ